MGKSRQELLKARQARMNHLIQEEKLDNPINEFSSIKDNEIEDVKEETSQLNKNESNIAKGNKNESDISESNDSEKVLLQDGDLLNDKPTKVKDSIPLDEANLENKKQDEENNSLESIDTVKSNIDYNTENTTVTVFRLNYNNYRYIEIMAVQKDMSYRDYINEELEKIHKYLDTVPIDPFSITPPSRGERYLRSFEITQENLDFINSYRKKYGMKKADFVNYLFDLIRMR